MSYITKLFSVEEIQGKIDKFCTIDPITNCKNWEGSLCKGYGRVRFGHEIFIVSRLVYEINNPDVDMNNLVVRHKCDNKRCCNINHLEIGTHQQNIKEAVERLGMNKGGRNGNSKLTIEEIKEARRLLNEGFPIAVVARRFNVHESTMSRVHNSKSWIE